VRTLLGPGLTALPVGRVGDDAAGARLLAEMETAGLSTKHVARTPGCPTLYSFCFVYPDASGGNMTTSDSACGRVDAAQITHAEPEFRAHAGRGIALAAPEVPLGAREALLELGGRHRFLRVASFTSGEAAEVLQRGILGNVDLLAVNRHEAAAMAECSAEDRPAEAVAEAAVRRARSVNPHLMLTITAGRQGSWAWDGAVLTPVPAFEAPVASTAGAGDAHLAGTLAGLTAGLPLCEAAQLGALVASLSVTSPHTIHPGIDRVSLKAFTDAGRLPLRESVRRLLSE
jgi:ribokinase